MAVNYAYRYAMVRAADGRCTATRDTTTYILDPTFVPIDDINAPYLLKYYWPLPTTVTSHDDFQGKWYSDANHTIEVPELNN